MVMFPDSVSQSGRRGVQRLPKLLKLQTRYLKSTAGGDPSRQNVKLDFTKLLSVFSVAGTWFPGRKSQNMSQQRNTQKENCRFSRQNQCNVKQQSNLWTCIRVRAISRSPLYSRGLFSKLRVFNIVCRIVYFNEFNLVTVSFNVTMHERHILFALGDWEADLYPNFIFIFVKGALIINRNASL